MKASLYPDVHPNKPGRYRYFYEITIRRKPVLSLIHIYGIGVRTVDYIHRSIPLVIVRGGLPA